MSTYNPQTGVNMVDASVYMLVRGSRSHTVDIRMQQVPHMFGDAPGIVVRPWHSLFQVGHHLWGALFWLPACVEPRDLTCRTC